MSRTGALAALLTHQLLLRVPSRLGKALLQVSEQELGRLGSLGQRGDLKGETARTGNTVRKPVILNEPSRPRSLAARN